MLAIRCLLRNNKYIYFPSSIVVEFCLYPGDDLHGGNDGCLCGSLLWNQRILLFNNISVCSFGIWDFRTGCSSSPTRVHGRFGRFHLFARRPLHVCHPDNIHYGKSSHCVLGNTRECPTTTATDTTGREGRIWKPNDHSTHIWRFLFRKISPEKHHFRKHQKVSIYFFFFFFFFFFF